MKGLWRNKMRDCDEPNFGSDLGREHPAEFEMHIRGKKKQLTKWKEG
jgi:hypothetical protein